MTKSTNQDLRKALNQMKQRFRILDNTLKTGSKHLEEGAAEELKTEIDINYKNFIQSIPNDHHDHSYNINIVPRDGGGYDIQVIGTEVIYDEFGTGIVGLQNQHPTKGNHKLNAYNTGPTIRHFPDSNRDYWIYPMNGKFYVSHGVPAGQFIYDAISSMADGIWVNNYYKIAFEDLFEINKK